MANSGIAVINAAYNNGHGEYGNYNKNFILVHQTIFSHERMGSGDETTVHSGQLLYVLT